MLFFYYHYIFFYVSSTKYTSSMGNIFTQFWDRFAWKQESRILMLGLDAAGNCTA
jgi:hypothetical protein